MAISSPIGSLIRGLVHFFFGNRGKNNSDEQERPLTSEELQSLRELPFLCRMKPVEETRFFELCGTFLKEVTITGLEGYEPTDEDRVKIAASCALLYVGRPEWPFPPIKASFLSPTNFHKRKFTPHPQGKWAGFYHEHEESVYLSRKYLLSSFTCDHDGFNLGIHEFAHALDGQVGGADGRLPYMTAAMKQKFNPVLKREMKKAGKPGAALPEYGSTNLWEAFATAIELFIENPLRLQNRAPDLYTLLSVYLNQDPLAYDQKQLHEEVDSIVLAYMSNISPMPDMREGMIFMKGQYLHACYMTDIGTWSLPHLVGARVFAIDLPYKPEKRLPVTIELRRGKIESISHWGKFPPLLPRHLEKLLFTLTRKLPKVDEEMLKEAIKNSWLAQMENGPSESSEGC